MQRKNIIIDTPIYVLEFIYSIYIFYLYFILK